MLRLTPHEKHEWTRCADALLQLGSIGKANTLREAVAKGTLPASQFDPAASIYRAWLVFGEV